MKRRSHFVVRAREGDWQLRDCQERIMVNREYVGTTARLGPDDVVSGSDPLGRFFLFLPGAPERSAELESTLDADASDGEFLVYADWLQERGDPLGATILQCHTYARGSGFPRFLLGQRLRRLRMRFCFWTEVQLDAKGPDWIEVLAAVLLFPRGRFLRSLTVRGVPDDQCDAWLQAVLRARPPTLRDVALGSARWSA